MTVNVKHSHPKTIIQNAAGAADSRWPTGVTASAAQPLELTVNNGVATNQAVGSPTVAEAGTITFSAQAGFTVTGTFASGQTITVSSSSQVFTAKTNAKVKHWFDASNESCSAGYPSDSLGIDSTYRSGRAPDGERAQDVVASGSTHVWRYDHYSGTAAILGRVEFLTGRFYMWRKLYQDFDILQDYGPDGFNYKYFRIWNSTDNQNVGGSLFTPSGGGNDDNYEIFWEKSNVQIPKIDPEDPNWSGQPQTWMVEELVFEDSDPSDTNATCDFWQRGYMPYDGAVFQSRDNSIDKDYVVHAQVADSTGKNPTYSYYDSVYIDDCWHRILISPEAEWQDGSNYTSASFVNREVQLPTAWTSSEVQFHMRFGSMSSLSGMYLYIVDGTNTAHKIGQFN
jgi:hypothetical protein